jgi:hypothetical protein
MKQHQYESDGSSLNACQPPCQWDIAGTQQGHPICSPGDGSCSGAKLLEAEHSHFHDHHLSDATKKINQILASIPHSSDNHKLSFLVTDMGVLLAWVGHGEVPDNPVNAKSDKASVVKALKLKNTDTAEK